MSDDREEVTVSDEGITVRKSLNTDQFQTLAIVFDVLSERNAPARIQLVDEVPGAIEMDNVGFHPDYGGEHWTAEGHRVVFERTFEPGEEYTTIYGIRGVDPDEMDLLGAPAVGLIDGDDAEVDEVVPPGRSQVVRDLISGEADAATIAGQTQDEPAAPAEPAETPEPAEAAAEDVPEEPAEAEEPEPVAAAADVGGNGRDEAAPAESAPPADAGAEPEPATDDRDITVPVDGGVARVLAKELRDGRVSESDRALLVDSLTGGSGSLDTRIEHLQARVSDLDAYTSALEEFLDENGTAQELLASIDDRMDYLDGSMRELGDELDHVDDRTEEVADLVHEVEDSTAKLDRSVGGLEDEVSALRDDLEGMREDVERVDGLARRLDRFERTVDDLQDDFEAMRDELDEMATFRDRLSTVFGAGGMGTESLSDEE